MENKIFRIERALERLAAMERECRLCPRECRTNRIAGETGFCLSGPKAVVSHALVHYGEEPILSGYDDWKTERKTGRRAKSGSGTIFFAGCNLKCLFCQNYQLSWQNKGRLVEDEELAGMMLGLQRKGARNINLVSPTHLILPILRALKKAIRQGLTIPIVSNSNGYEKADILENLRGIIDIYLPDLKYHSPRISARLSGAEDYFQQAGPAIQEMYGQQPDLVLDDDGFARRGLIIRHLVLPGCISDSLSLLEWIREALTSSASLSLMSQYHPCFRAPDDLRRPLMSDEYRRVVSRARNLGFENLFIQSETFETGEHLVPDFSLRDPFRWEKR